MDENARKIEKASKEFLKSREPNEQTQ